MLTFTYCDVKIPIDISDHTLRSIRTATRRLQSCHPDDFAKISNTIEKIAPIALAILATVTLMPLWSPACSLLSVFVGPFAYPLAAIGAVKGYRIAQDLSQEFFKQCPEIKNAIACSYLLISKNIL